ncbi:hypothetical protein ABW21_db0201693 [Orbilia brochopaga]|nr:hypothetical protein ABW21_db0201693 [Drechslerella brochopaga]
MRRGVRFNSLWLTLLYAFVFLSRPTNAEWPVRWQGKIMSIEFNRVFYESLNFLRTAYLTNAFCLTDGTEVGAKGKNQIVGANQGVKGGLSQSIQEQDAFSVNAWQQLECAGDKDASQWDFVGNNGTKGTKINDNPMGVALHDYAIGQLRNKKTERCLALIRDDGADASASIETVGHSIRSVDCDEKSKDSKQLWVVYFGGDDPFAPLIPADALGACNSPNTAKGDDGNWKYDRVPGAVYEDTAADENLKQVDARYVAMSTFDFDDGGGVSPVARCTGMKWAFGPGFSRDLIELNAMDQTPLMEDDTETDGYNPDDYDDPNAEFHTQDQKRAVPFAG